jgi:dethiobiotin synthetase
MIPGLFVTGTDTGVGKTHVTVALLAALRLAGVRAVGMKPVAAGIDAGRQCNADVTALAAADGMEVDAADRNPYAFVPAIAPHLAAREVNVSIDPAVIEVAFGRLCAVASVVLVEGAGGVRVPLAPGFDMLDVAARLGLPVLLVVGVRLGCLNHALLSADAIRARGLRMAGWVANRMDPHMARTDDNIAALAELLELAPVADRRWGVTGPLPRPAVDKLMRGVLSSDPG